MPTGIYERTKEHKAICRDNLKKRLNQAINCDRCGRLFTKKHICPTKEWYIKNNILLHSKEAVNKARLTRLARIKSGEIITPIGEKHHNWIGDRVGYQGLHIWIRRYKPKSEVCENCGNQRRKLDLANISGKYKRDINDFRWLCRGCHIRLDVRDNWFIKKHKILRDKNGRIMGVKDERNKN